MVYVVGHPGCKEPVIQTILKEKISQVRSVACINIFFGLKYLIIILKKKSTVGVSH